MKLKNTWALMEERCISSSKLSKRFGVNNGTFNRIINGQLRPPKILGGVFWTAIDGLIDMDLLRETRSRDQRRNPLKSGPEKEPRYERPDRHGLPA